MKQKRGWLGVLVILGGLLLTTACSSPPAIQESDLVGVWYVNYTDYVRSHVPLCDTEEAARLTEILLLRSDGEYRQMFWDQEEGLEQENQGQWFLERFSDGVVRLHLEGGESYPHENCGDWRGIVGYFDDGTGHELTVDTGEEAVLHVRINRLRGNLYLAYPYVRDPDAPVVVKLHRLTEQQ